MLTHGGSVANLTALTAARSAISPDSWNDGNPKDLVVIGSASAHYSILRSLSILGLGKKCFVPIPVDKNEIIDLNQLESIYKKLIVQGKTVMCLIANACATSTGLFDPLDQMGDFCEKYNIWSKI